MTGVATLRQRPFLWVTSLAGHQRGVGDAAPYTLPCGSCRGEHCSPAGFFDCRQIARANAVRPYVFFSASALLLLQSCVIAKLWFTVGADSISARAILCNHPLARRGQNPSLQTCINAIQQGKCQPPPKNPPQKQKSVTCGYRLRFKRKIAYSAWIAPVGQTPSQAPQSTQEAASTTALSSMLIAPTGQVSTHAPQATHSLETV